MPIRITGMNSGLDTESIISELVKAKSAKKDTLVKNQTKLQWKQDAWKELNSKVYSFYSKTLSNMRFTTDFIKKNTKVSNPNAATVITGGNAVNGVQTLQVSKLAKTGYLTGAELQKDGSKANYTTSTKLTDLGVTSGSEFSLTVNGKTTSITVGDGTSIADFTTKLQAAGINASFDEKNQRFFLSAKKSGLQNDFSLTATNLSSQESLSKLGLNAAIEQNSADYKYYKSLKDSISENGFVITDSDELYEKIKDLTQGQVDGELSRLIKEYNATQNSINSKQESYDKAVEKFNEFKTNYAGDSDIDFDAFSAEGLKQLKDNAPEKPAEDATEDDKAAYEAYNKKITDYEDALKQKKTMDSFEELQNKLSDIASKLDIPADGYDDKGNIKEGVTLAESYENDFHEKAITAYKEKALYAVSVVDQVDNGLGAASGTNLPTRVSGQDSEIYLNGAMFTSSSNTFEINGLTITANTETAEPVTLTTDDDTDGIYDMIKNFFKEYNALINEMDKLYNADAAKGYSPLTEEEKDAMSEKEIEKWEQKIKDSVLRRDSTLSTVASAMKEIMLSGVKMSDGSQVNLSKFGIATLGYFTAPDNEKNAYHIDGDSDDLNTSGNADLLKSAIANDPSTVIEFFTSLSKNLYGKLGDLMKGTEFSSSFTLYDDKNMKSEYDDFTSKIKRQDTLITDYEDRYYKKFSKMETAMAKMQSKQNAISGFFGG